MKLFEIKTKDYNKKNYRNSENEIIYEIKKENGKLWLEEYDEINGDKDLNEIKNVYEGLKSILDCLDDWIKENKKELSKEINEEDYKE